MKSPHDHLTQAVRLLAPLMRPTNARNAMSRSRSRLKLQDMTRAQPWFRTNNVVGVVVSRKTSGPDRRRGDLSLKFLVRRKIPVSRLAITELIPPQLKLRSIEEEILTDVEFCPEIPIANGAVLQIPAMPRIRPVMPGIWVGHQRASGGTLGLVVKFGGEDHYLSCAHVFAPGGSASVNIGDSIEQPADLLGQMTNNIIASLSDFTSVETESLDAAIAKVNGVAYQREVLQIGVPDKILPWPASRFTDFTMILSRVGAMTGLQEGAVDSWGSQDIWYQDLGEQIIVHDVVTYNAKNDAGDSGAAVFVKGSRTVAGMHIGALSSSQSLCLPIQPIFTRLKLTLA